jgi:putative hemolysin
MPETAFEIAVILLLIMINGLFAMSEIAVVSARPIRLQQMAQRGSRGAATALELIDSPNRFLSTVQVGITLVGIFAGAYGGANIAGELADSLQEISWLARYAGALSLIIVVGAITFLSVVIGELVPKRIALGYAEAIASAVSRPMRALSIVAGPVVRLLSAATDLTLRLLGISTPEAGEVNEEEIRLLVQQGAETGAIMQAEREMVESIFRLGDRSLESMMTPRVEIVWLDINASEEETLVQVRASKHSRFPVCDGDLDRVLGVALAKDLLINRLQGRPYDIRAIMQEPILVPEKMEALKALELFKQKGQQMALVFDEYGGIEGLVTLFDLLEAIVGDIPTAEEVNEPPILQREDGSWLVDGLISIDDFKDAFAIDLLPDEGKYQTLGGFVVKMVGSIPAAGNHFAWGGFRFEVVDMDGYRVDKVLVEAAAPAAAPDDSPSEPPAG